MSTCRKQTSHVVFFAVAVCSELCENSERATRARAIVLYRDKHRKQLLESLQESKCCGSEIVNCRKEMDVREQVAFELPRKRTVPRFGPTLFRFLEPYLRRVLPYSMIYYNLRL